MPFYRRRLPHIYEIGQPVFVTWRLYGSLPPHRASFGSAPRSGHAFVALDKLLDQAEFGPFYLRQPAIAELTVESLNHHANVENRFSLHAFVVMPNHVHILITPHIPLPQITRAVKGFTARAANNLLGLRGTPFWQHESFDRLVRDEREFHRIKAYIEWNPVRAALVKRPEDYRWSSAFGL